MAKRNCATRVGGADLNAVADGIERRLARIAGLLIAGLKAIVPPRRDPAPGEALPQGISVVIPSRDGLDLLDRVLPGVVADLEGIHGEVIVVDNGSSDGTAAHLAAHWPQVRIEVDSQPLAFSAAVNRGIRLARYSHVCLLNNDMVIRPGFFSALLRAFGQVPDLFCATAQIFFPEGERRQETGLAVKPPREADSTDPGFPLWCNEPLPGEDLSWVLYGSGGCSLYDTQKLRCLGLFDETYSPAYVEDLDIGYRAWQRRWPTVFVARAVVLHHHRATTLRFFSAEELDLVVEVNYLRFLARAVASPRVFLELWRENLRRPLPAAALRFALRAWRCLRWPPEHPFSEESILRLGSGQIRVFPGRAGTCGEVMVRKASSTAPPPREWLDQYRMVILAQSEPACRAAFDQASDQWPGSVIRTPVSRACGANSR